MKVYVKNKLVSLRGSSNVVNENNEPVYMVQGKFFSPTKKKKICDLEGRVLYIVRNKWFNFFMPSTYICDENGEKLARLKKSFSFKPNFVLEGYRDEIMIDGQAFNRHMQVIKNGEKMGTISREFDLFSDSFCVDCEPADMPFMIALTISIDNIYDKMSDDRH